MFSKIIRTLSIASALILVALYPALSSAVSLTGESNTYLQFRETTDQSKLAPLFMSTLISGWTILPTILSRFITADGAKSTWTTRVTDEESMQICNTHI